MNADPHRPDGARRGMPSARWNHAGRIAGVLAAIGLIWLGFLLLTILLGLASWAAVVVWAQVFSR